MGESRNSGALPGLVMALAALGGCTQPATPPSTAPVASNPAASAPVASAPVPPPPAIPSPRTASAVAANGDRLVAHGNEPFWAIEVDGDRLLWKTPELPEGRALVAERRVHATGAGYTGNDGGKPFSLVILVEPCSDGMSDRAYDYTATWTYAGQAMHGCAAPR